MNDSPADQTDVFRSGEGDEWFRRNRAGLGHVGPDDPVLKMIAAALAGGARFTRVCELGCANGWRLAALRELLPTLEETAGSDISVEAIADGSFRWPELELSVGSLDEPNVAGTFDLVIVSFVLHWVSRERLARSIAAIDAIVADGGVLIICDFLPDSPCARKYHHRADVELFTYKQDYSEAFTGLGTYSKEKAEVFSHSPTEGTIRPEHRAACFLLRKNLTAYPLEAGFI